jgi:inner membrane protein
MDPLTHTAVGLFLGRVGLNRWSPRATPILLLAANAPDIDIVALGGGSLQYLHYHRHLTHSLIAMPVLALLAVTVVRYAGRKAVRWTGAWAAATLAVASHLLLDWTNAYGLRPFLPFSGRWYQLDLNNIVDLWLWTVFLLALLGPFVARLVGSEIASTNWKPRRHGRGFAVFALAFLVVYDWGRSVLHTRAVATLEARLYQGSLPSRVAALPEPANPFHWRGLVETGGFYAVAGVDLAGAFDPTRAMILHKPDPSTALDAASASPTFQEFLRFSQYPFWRVLPAAEPENGRVVEALDLRFGTPEAPAFVASALLDSRLRVIETRFHWGTLRPR